MSVAARSIVAILLAASCQAGRSDHEGGPGPGGHGGTIGAGGGAAGAAAGAGAVGGTAVGAGGSSGTTGVAGDGGTSGNAGSRAGGDGTDAGGAAGIGSGTGGAGGAGGGASGRGGAAAGAAGAAGGAGSAGAGGAAGAADGGRAIAAVLDGFAIAKPCVSTFKPSGNASNSGDCCCEEDAASENQHVTKQLGGDPSVTYDVKLRIAGVAERYWYSGGALDPAKDTFSNRPIFYVGGLPTIHGAQAPNDNLQPGQGACKIHPPQTDGASYGFALSFTVPPEIRPADGCYNGFNIFAMTVSSPKQSYYLNDTTDFDGVDRQPHAVYKTDYTVTIPVSGQAQLDFYTIDGDHHEVTNNGTMTVSNVKTAQPYNGNFLELTVLDVTRAN